MLFDLRAGGRRRLVQAVYLMLALLLGGGLVLFGIGGDVSGGLFDAFREDSSQSNATQQFEDRLDEQEKRLQANPNDQAALAEVAKLHYQIAGTGENFNEEQGRFTAEGLAELREAERAWNRYLATDPDPVESGVAIQMVQVFGQAGLNKPDEAVQACRLLLWAVSGFAIVEGGSSRASGRARPRRSRRPGGDPSGVTPAEADELFALHVRYLIDGIERDRTAAGAGR